MKPCKQVGIIPPARLHLNCEEAKAALEKAPHSQLQLNPLPLPLLHTIINNNRALPWLLQLSNRPEIQKVMSNACSFTLAKALNCGAFVVRRSLNFGLKHTQKCPVRSIRMEAGNGNGESRGALIVLEGLDRSGKSSQASRLLSYLEGQGHSAELWRFPDRTTSVGQMISAYLSNKSQLDDHTIHLLFSANRWEKRSLMEAQLKSGTSLIVDRYSYSGVAFSSAKGLDVEWCKAPETGLLAPDLVVYLDIPPEKAAERGGYGGERYEQLEFQKKVSKCYQSLRDSSWKIIDATQSVEDVEKQIEEIVLDRVVECKNGRTLSNLWPA